MRILRAVAVVWVLWPAGMAHAECPLGGGLPAFATGSVSAPAAVSYSTLLGGECDEESLGVAQDGAGNVYVAGVVKSSITFPASPGAFDETYNGGPSDAFVAHSIDPTPVSLPLRDGRSTLFPHVFLLSRPR